MTTAERLALRLHILLTKGGELSQPEKAYVVLLQKTLFPPA
jgi:hypothetical protein